VDACGKHPVEDHDYFEKRLVPIAAEINFARIKGVEIIEFKLLAFFCLKNKVNKELF